MTEEKQLLTNREAAALLNVSHTTYYQWVKDGLITRVRLPGSSRTRVRRKTLMEFLDALPEQVESDAHPTDQEGPR